MSAHRCQISLRVPYYLFHFIIFTKQSSTFNTSVLKEAEVRILEETLARYTQASFADGSGADAQGLGSEF
jgi:hypothetical protein